MAYKVFFSHSVQDKQWVKMITKDLVNIGINVYLFQYDVQAGNYHADKVKRAIKECDSFMVLITKSSQSSQYVQQEIGAASGLEKPIVPLVETGIESSKLAMLEGREYIEFDHSKPYESMQKISSFLSQDRHVKERNRNIGLGIIAGTVLWALLAGKEGE